MNSGKEDYRENGKEGGQSSGVQDRRIYTLSREKPVRAVVKMGVPLIAVGARVLRTLMCILPFVGAVSMSRMSFQAMGKPQYAFGITLVRRLVLYVPLLLLLNRRFGFGGMIWAQPVTEMIMMAVSVWLLARTIRAEE